jgi:26S proteasome regulatory subunit N1
MAKEGERSAPADKGKGKVDDVKDLAGGKKDKPEEKTQANSKQKDDEPQEGTQPLCSLDTRRHP